MEENDRLREENKRLKRAVDELSILNELASAIGGLNNSEEIIRKILNRALRALNAEQGVVTLVAEGDDNPLRTLVRSSFTSSEHTALHFNDMLLGWMTHNKSPITLNDPVSDRRFGGAEWNPMVRSLVCVPMLVRSGLKGILTVYNKKNSEKFSDDDQRLLSIIAAQSAQVIENARLYEEESALMKIRRELDLASQIQSDLLPKGKPEMPGYDIAGATFPARSVGGDFFDFIPIEDWKLALCLGDVSGKGLPAALLMTNIQASLRSEAFLGKQAHECVERMNKQLFLTTGPEKFATLFYSILDGRSNTLSYCNAGHEPPFLISDNGAPRRLNIGGTVIGAIDPMSFMGASVSFDPGNFLVAYSDGVTEAMDNNMIQFGEDKLSRLITENAGLTAAELVKLISDAVKAHAGSAPQHDDITALVIKREK